MQEHVLQALDHVVKHVVAEYDKNFIYTTTKKIDQSWRKISYN